MQQSSLIRLNSRARVRAPQWAFYPLPRQYCSEHISRELAHPATPFFRSVDQDVSPRGIYWHLWDVWIAGARSRVSATISNPFRHQQAAMWPVRWEAGVSFFYISCILRHDISVYQFIITSASSLLQDSPFQAPRRLALIRNTDHHCPTTFHRDLSSTSSFAKMQIKNVAVVAVITNI